MTNWFGEFGYRANTPAVTMSLTSFNFYYKLYRLLRLNELLHIDIVNK